MLRMGSVWKITHIIITVMGSGTHECSRRFAFMSQLPLCTSVRVQTVRL